MAKILGLPLDGYVDKQINVRQQKLAKNQKRPEELSVFNSNTSWVRLTSAVSVVGDEQITGPTQPTSELFKINRVNILSNKLGISADKIKGNALARNLVLFNGISSFTPGKDKVSLDPIKGGIGYGLNNTYGFLSGPEQGLKPPPGITSITCNYKNNGSLKQATVNLKCFTRSQFEAIEAVYLRLGYTMVLEWGNTLFFDNDGEFKRTLFYSIPNILFNTENSISPQTVTSRLLFNKKSTACNYDGMLARVANYSWTLNEDLSFDIKLDLVSVGDIIDSLKMNVGGTNPTDNSSKITASPETENLVSIIINKEASRLNAFFYELYELIKPVVAVEGSSELKEQIKNIDEAVETLPLLDSIKEKYISALNEFRKYYDLLDEAAKISKEAKVFTGGTFLDLYTLPTDKQDRFRAISENLNTTELKLIKALDPASNPASGKLISNYDKSLDAIEKYFNNLKVVVNTGETPGNDDLITSYFTSKNPKDDIIRSLSLGGFIEGTDIPDSKLTDDSLIDSDLANILEDLFEGLDVGKIRIKSFF